MPVHNIQPVGKCQYKIFSPVGMDRKNSGEILNAKDEIVKIITNGWISEPAVGEAVGVWVGVPVGLEVGDFEGEAVGVWVGVLVGLEVGDFEGVTVGDTCKKKNGSTNIFRQ
jgi:hypothetical protein